MTPSTEDAPLAVALDLGSTKIKAGRLGADRRLSGIRSVPSPALLKNGTRHEGDALAWCRAAESLLRDVGAGIPPMTPLGIASQRSTFLLWERRSGRPVTPLISWQDRRAVAWCERHPEARDEIERRCGLILSPHYVGPKLAVLQEENPTLRRDLHAGELLFGTLETFMAWRWTGGRVHATDATMAARTCLFDLTAGDWSIPLLDLFGVPTRALPSILPTAGRDHPLANGFTLTTSLADQAAVALALLDGGTRDALVNAGTGAFILRSAERPDERRRGYLTAPLFGSAAGPESFVMEGTINGPGALLGRFASRALDLPDIDPSPGIYCLPDAAGLGSPHWRADLGFRLSVPARRLNAARRRAVVLEGILFRSREILEQLFPHGAPDRLVLAGGLSRIPAFGIGLAALLGRPVEAVLEPEQTLLGTARLAAGVDPRSPSDATFLPPGWPGAYLAEKYTLWNKWVGGLLSS